MPRRAQIALLVHLDRPGDLAEELTVLRDAVRTFFGHRADSSRKRLRQVLRDGRVSLSIGLIFLAAAIGVGSVLANSFLGRASGALLREGLLIGGWVAMWRPLEIFLYDWWPIRAEAALFDRLSAMPVRIVQTQGATAVINSN